MSKSTEDCKVFLTDFFARNPQIIKALFGSDAAEMQAFTTNKKNWKRIWKCKAGVENGTKDEIKEKYLIYVDGKPVNKYADGHEYRPASDYLVARGFDCSPAEGAIAYIVLEAGDGTLTLGDYIGD